MLVKNTKNVLVRAIQACNFSDKATFASVTGSTLADSMIMSDFTTSSTLFSSCFAYSGICKMPRRPAAVTFLQSGGWRLTSLCTLWSLGIWSRLNVHHWHDEFGIYAQYYRRSGCFGWDCRLTSDFKNLEFGRCKMLSGTQFSGCAGFCRHFTKIILACEINYLEKWGGGKRLYLNWGVVLWLIFQPFYLSTHCKQNLLGSETYF